MDKIVKKSATRAITTIWEILIWLTGIIVSLAVGFGMTSGVLGIPNISQAIVAAAGWIVIVLTILGAILAMIDKLSG